MKTLQPNLNNEPTDRERAEIAVSQSPNIEEKLAEQGWSSLSPVEKINLNYVVAAADGVAASEVEESRVLEYHRKLKIELLKKTCEETILEGFLSTNGHFYRTNRDDQVNMIGQRDLLTSNLSLLKVKWKTEDADYVWHTRDEWMKVYDEAFLHKQNNLFKYDELKKQVETAQTHEEVEVIQWNT